jgi:hypothetical protein
MQIFLRWLNGRTGPSIELYTYILRRCLEVQSSITPTPSPKASSFMMRLHHVAAMHLQYEDIIHHSTERCEGLMRLWGEASKTHTDIHMSRKCGRYPFWGDPQNRHFRRLQKGSKRLHFEPFLALFKALKRPLKSLKKGSFLTYFRPKTAFIGGYLNNILLDGI